MKNDKGLKVATSHGVQKRSAHWPGVERTHLSAEPACVACGHNRFPVQVHHIIPFHFAVLLGRPDLELDTRNLVTLCESKRGVSSPNHHLLIGHLGSFRSSNVRAREDASGAFRGMTEEQIEASDAWRARVAGRMKPWGWMTVGEKADFRLLMDRLFPPR